MAIIDWYLNKKVLITHLSIIIRKINTKSTCKHTIYILFVNQCNELENEKYSNETFLIMYRKFKHFCLFCICSFIIAVSQLNVIEDLFHILQQKYKVMVNNVMPLKYQVKQILFMIESKIERNELGDHCLSPHFSRFYHQIEPRSV